MPRIKQAVKDILWMSRRYANTRQTYASSMFNDAYDILRSELGDEIDLKNHPPYDAQSQNKSYDVALEQGEFHPYALYGNDLDSQSNEDLKHRKYYEGDVPPAKLRAKVRK